MTIHTPAPTLRGENLARAFLAFMDIVKNPDALKATLVEIDKHRDAANEAVKEAKARIAEAEEIEQKNTDRETAVVAQETEISERIAKLGDDEASHESAVHKAEEAGRARESVLDDREGQIKAREKETLSVLVKGA
jgi:hypothetical protein